MPLLHAVPSSSALASGATLLIEAAIEVLIQCQWNQVLGIVREAGGQWVESVRYLDARSSQLEAPLSSILVILTTRKSPGDCLGAVKSRLVPGRAYQCRIYCSRSLDTRQSSTWNLHYNDICTEHQFEASVLPWPFDRCEIIRDQVMLLPLARPMPRISTEDRASFELDTVESMDIFSGSLTNLLNGLNQKSINIYTRGVYSNYIGRRVSTSFENGGVDGTLVLMDRTADMIPVSCHTDSILDVIMNSLNLSESIMHAETELLGVRETHALDFSDPTSQAIIEELASSGEKDALMNFRKRVHDYLQRSDIKVPKQLGKVSANQLLKLVSLLPENVDASDSGLKEALVCITEALQTSTAQHWNEAMAIEKILLVTSRELTLANNTDFTDIFHQLGTILSSEKSMDCEKFSKFLLLLIYTYSVIGKEIHETDEETLLMNVVLKSMLLMPPTELQKFIHFQSDRDVLPQMEELLQRWFSKLRKLSALQSKHFIKNQSSGYKPFCLELADHLFSGGSPESAGLVRIPCGKNLVSQAITDVSRRMWNASSGINSDAPVIVCVIGGISWEEIKEVLVHSRNSRTKIVLVSSHLMIHEKMIANLFTE